MHNAMAWERRRNGRLYFYRTRYVAGRTVKEYVGRGPKAEQAAKEDASKRAQREACLLSKRERRREYESVQMTFTALAAECQSLVRASLLSAGYYQHARGKWRKRRGNGHPEETE